MVINKAFDYRSLTVVPSKGSTIPFQSQDFTQEVHPKVLLKAEAHGPRGLAFTQGLESAVVQLKQTEDVMVVITTTASEEWSFGGGRGN